jgi:hypothetical protein
MGISGFVFGRLGALLVDFVAGLLLVGRLTLPLRLATVFLTVMMDSYWWIGEILLSGG